MDAPNIKETLINILSDKLKVVINTSIPDFDDYPLTGSIHQLTSVSLVYLFFEVESLFRIRVPPEELQNYGFNSLNGISKIILQCLEHKNGLDHHGNCLNVTKCCNDCSADSKSYS